MQPYRNLLCISTVGQEGKRKKKKRKRKKEKKAFKRSSTKAFEAKEVTLPPTPPLHFPPFPRHQQARYCEATEMPNPGPVGWRNPSLRYGTGTAQASYMIIPCTAGGLHSYHTGIVMQLLQHDRLGTHHRRHVHRPAVNLELNLKVYS